MKAKLKLLASAALGGQHASPLEAGQVGQEGLGRGVAQERGQLETEIQELKVDIALKTERLDALRNTLAYVSY